MSWTRQAFRAFSASFRQHPKYYLGAMSMPLVAHQAHLWSISSFKESDNEEYVKPVYLWGNNLYGVADPSTYGKEETVRYPRQVGSWRGISLSSVALGSKHAAAVDEEGNVYQWGESFWQRSGIFGTFRPVCTLKSRGCTMVRVNEGGVYALDGDGRIIVLSLDASQPAQTLELDEKIVDVQAGRSHLIALGENGTVFTGSTNRYGNIFGQLGRGPTDSTRRALEQMQHPSLLPESIMNVVQGWPRSEQSIEQEALSVDPKQTGSDSLFKDTELHPIDSKWWEGGKPVQVAAGDHHSVVLTEYGHVYGFGSNEMLQLGIGQYDPAQAINPFPVSILKPDPGARGKASFVACGAETSYFVVDSDRQTEILAAGFGQYGQLGNKTWTHAQGTPSRVHAISALSYYDEDSKKVSPIRCRYVSAGAEHAAAVMNTFVRGSIICRYGYDVYVWGGNRAWQLGLANRRNNVAEPVSVEPPDPTRTDVDYTDLALSKSGPTTVNPEHTLTFVGGQLQILPNTTKDKENPEPIHTIHCGHDVTIIY